MAENEKIMPPSKTIFENEEEFERFAKMSNLEKKVFLSKHKDKMLSF